MEGINKVWHFHGNDENAWNGKFQEIRGGLIELREEVGNRDLILFHFKGILQTPFWTSIVDSYNVSKDLKTFF